MKRNVDLIVLSDVHLGTVGCRAEELVSYLKSVKPEMLVLNGDLIDIWNFRKFYWPESHMEVLKQILKFISEDVQVYYLTGNHDELLRKITPLSIGNFHLKNKIVLELDSGKTWIFHGDIFDVTMKHSKWLAKLGAVGYDLLIIINNIVNTMLEIVGHRRISLSKRIKNSVKKAISFIDDFEMTAMELALQNRYKAVVCGHIHQPKKRVYKNEDGEVLYLNSGDWIENLTSLEYHNGYWTIYNHITHKDVAAVNEPILRDGEMQMVTEPAGVLV